MPKASKTATAPRKTAGGTAPASAGNAKPAAPQADSAPPTKPARRAAGSRAAASAAKPAKAAESPAPAPAPAKRAAGRKAAPAAVEHPVTDKFMQEQKTQLLAERAGYVQQAETLKAEAEALAQEMEPGDIQFDEESGEGGTLNVERERDLALSAQARMAVDEIDRSLAKIDAGTYGICEGCGEPIKRARLKALPYASLCVACKSGGLSRR